MNINKNLLEAHNQAFCQISLISRFDSEVFTPPFRLGRKQKRSILDANGKEVVIMPHNSEKQAQLYCDYLNGYNVMQLPEGRAFNHKITLEK